LENKSPAVERAQSRVNALLAISGLQAIVCQPNGIGRAKVIFK